MATAFFLDMPFRISSEISPNSFPWISLIYYLGLLQKFSWVFFSEFRNILFQIRAEIFTRISLWVLSEIYAGMSSAVTPVVHSEKPARISTEIID